MTQVYPMTYGQKNLKSKVKEEIKNCDFLLYYLLLYHKLPPKLRDLKQ